LNFIKEKI